MSIIDALKNSIVAQFDTSLSVKDILLSLLVAFIISALIVLVYRKTFSGIVYSRSTALTIILLALATSMIIRTINSNLSLSLGMVGALSIVRFRTAIKDPVDTAFLFWAVTAGIMAGTGLYLIAIIGSLGIGIIFFIAYLVSVKAKAQYLLIFSYSIESEAQVLRLLAAYKEKKLKSKSINGNMTELTYQVVNNKALDSLMSSLRDVASVKNINLVTYTNDFGM